MSTPTAADTITLNALHVGDHAFVIAVSGEAAAQARLHARGLAPGASLTVLRRGNPMLIAVDESRWAVNEHDAVLVEVGLVDASLASARPSHSAS